MRYYRATEKGAIQWLDVLPAGADELVELRSHSGSHGLRVRGVGLDRELSEWRTTERDAAFHGIARLLDARKSIDAALDALRLVAADGEAR